MDTEVPSELLQAGAGQVASQYASLALVASGARTSIADDLLAVETSLGRWLAYGVDEHAPGSR